MECTSRAWPVGFKRLHSSLTEEVGIRGTAGREGDVRLQVWVEWVLGFTEGLRPDSLGRAGGKEEGRKESFLFLLRLQFFRCFSWGWGPSCESVGTNDGTRKGLQGYWWVLRRCELIWASLPSGLRRKEFCPSIQPTGVWGSDLGLVESSGQGTEQNCDL